MPRVFHKVDWMAHEQAYKHIMRNQQISIVKLIHNLANTNRQNQLFYGTSNLCPGYQSLEETFKHVLKCNFHTTTKHCDECLKAFETNLTKISMPVPIVHTILHEFSTWLNSEPSSSSRAQMAGSL
jgi:hypothetical protein